MLCWFSRKSQRGTVRGTVRGTGGELAGNCAPFGKEARFSIACAHPLEHMLRRGVDLVGIHNAWAPNAWEVGVRGLKRCQCHCVIILIHWGIPWMEHELHHLAMFIGNVAGNVGCRVVPPFAPPWFNVAKGTPDANGRARLHTYPRSGWKQNCTACGRPPLAQVQPQHLRLGGRGARREGRRRGVKSHHLNASTSSGAIHLPSTEAAIVSL